MKLTPEERQQVIANARALVGVRWKHQGRTPWGVDCAGLVAMAFGAVVPVVDRTNYGRTPFQGELEAMVRANFGPPIKAGSISREDLQPGDVALMRWGDSPHHVALVVDHPDGLGLVHAYALSRKVIEHGLSDDWLASICEVYR